MEWSYLSDMCQWSALELDALAVTFLPPATGLREALALVKFRLPQAHLACRTCILKDFSTLKTGEKSIVYLLIFNLRSVFGFFRLEILKKAKWDVRYTSPILLLSLHLASLD